MKAEDFYKYVLPELPGVPDETLRQALMSIAGDFCVATHVWDEIADPIMLIAGVSDYDIDVPPGADIVTVKEVWGPLGELLPATMRDLQLKMPNWQTAEGTDPVYYNMVKGFGVLTVYPKPIAPTGKPITVHAVYAPKIEATTLPDTLVRDYRPAIEHGVKARLMAMPNKPWSNAMAGSYLQLYEAAKTEARGDVLHSRVPGSIRVRPIRFGG